MWDISSVLYYQFDYWHIWEVAFRIGLRSRRIIAYSYYVYYQQNNASYIAIYGNPILHHHNSPGFMPGLLAYNNKLYLWLAEPEQHLSLDYARPLALSGYLDSQLVCNSSVVTDLVGVNYRNRTVLTYQGKDVFLFVKYTQPFECLNKLYMYNYYPTDYLQSSSAN